MAGSVRGCTIQSHSVTTVTDLDKGQIFLAVSDGSITRTKKGGRKRTVDLVNGKIEIFGRLRLIIRITNCNDVF
jgi:hypothetical protein